MVTLKPGEDRELNLGEYRGIFIYVESSESENQYKIELIISDGVDVKVTEYGKIILTKPKKRSKNGAQG